MQVWGQIKLWKISFDSSQEELEVGLNDPYGSHPTWDILWFYDCSSIHLLSTFFSTPHIPPISHCSPHWKSPHTPINPLLCSLLALFPALLSFVSIIWRQSLKLQHSSTLYCKNSFVLPIATSQPAIADVKPGLLFQSAPLGIYLHWILLFYHAAIQCHRAKVLHYPFACMLSLFFLSAFCQIRVWRATNLLVFIQSPCTDSATRQYSQWL